MKGIGIVGIAHDRYFRPELFANSTEVCQVITRLNFDFNFRITLGKGGSGSKKFSSKEKRLPQNFAERVLELEMQIERDCSNVEMINQLLYLYSVSLDLLTDVDSKQWSITMG